MLEVEEPRRLVVTHFSPMTGQPDVPENYHTLRYELLAVDGGTRIELDQDNNPTAEAAEHSAENWRDMLDGMRTVVERSTAARPARLIVVPMAPMTASTGVPEASRLAPASGSVRADPSRPTASGSRPTQASARASSPFRKRWARTPPVARPLAGNSSKALTLAAARDRCRAASRCRSRRWRRRPRRADRPEPTVKWMTWRRRARLMPAMPPAGQPCGRTEAAAKRSSCASVVTKTSSSVSPPCTAPTTSSPLASGR